MGTSRPSLDDDMFEAPKDVTDESTPFFIQRPKTNVVPVTRTLDNGTPASAYVDASDPTAVNVQNPAAFNGPMAAHEGEHTWQFGRNPDFVDNLGIEQAHSVNAGDYDYGGAEGLAKNHPDLGNLNAEQQASIVGDLTKENMMLRPGMTREQLQAWDTKKKALERPIQQMLRVPAKPAPTAASQGDEWLKAHPKVSSFIPKALGPRPLEHLRDMISPPKPDPTPVYGTPDAPSAALGYANPSKLVRGGDITPPAGYTLDKP